MNLHKLIFTKNKCYIEGKKIKPQGIVVHSTGANNPNLKRYVGPDDGLLGENKYGNHWNNYRPGGRSVCAHGFIGKLADGTIASYQTLPWDHRGWHAGSGKKGSANNTHIGFEICEDGLKDPVYFAAVYKEAVELCAYLCREYGLDPLKDGVIIDHSEAHDRGLASNHGDVEHWFPRHGKSMGTLRADVAALLKGEQPKEETPKEEAPTVKLDSAKSFSKSLKGDYKVTAKSGLWLRTGASTGKEKLELMPYGSKVKCYGYHTGTWFYVVSATGKTGFCSRVYLKKV